MSSSSSKIVAIAHTLLIPTLLVIVIAAYENAPTFPHLSLFLPSMMRGLPRWRIIVVCLLPVCHDISSSLSYPRQTLWSNVTPSHNHLSPPQCSRLIVVLLLPRQPNPNRRYSDRRWFLPPLLLLSSLPRIHTHRHIAPHLQRRRNVGTMIPQLLPQLQTPEQNGGAAPIDALMPASAKGFK